MEIWKDIPTYEGRYQVSNLGRVKSYFNGERILQQEFTHDYFRIKLCGKNGKKRFQVHRLVLWAFDRPPIGNDVCNHIDANTRNNTLENLEWTTESLNVLHRISIGKYLTQSGEKQYNSKLKTNDVLEMRQLYKQGVSGVDLGKRYNVTPECALQVSKGKSWKHLPV